MDAHFKDQGLRLGLSLVALYFPFFSRLRAIEQPFLLFSLALFLVRESKSSYSTHSYVCCIQYRVVLWAVLSKRKEGNKAPEGKDARREREAKGDSSSLWRRKRSSIHAIFLSKLSPSLASRDHLITGSRDTMGRKKKKPSKPWCW